MAQEYTEGFAKPCRLSTDPNCDCVDCTERRRKAAIKVRLRALGRLCVVLPVCIAGLPFAAVGFVACFAAHAARDGWNWFEALNEWWS